LQDGLAIDVAPDGGLSVAGRYSGSIDFGGGPLPGAAEIDGFLASFDHDGKYRFAKRLGGIGQQFAVGVTVMSTGRAAVAGFFAGSVDLGGGALTSAGSWDAFMGAVDEHGAHQWSQQAGDAATQWPHGIAHSAWDDSLFVVGQMFGTLKLGACSARTSLDGDVWLGWLDSSGNCLQNLTFGDKGVQQALAVATNKGANNLVAIVGDFTGAIDIAAGLVQSEDDDAFVALFQADSFNSRLYPVWIRRIGGAGIQMAHAVAFDSADNLVVVGKHQGEDAAIGLPSADGTNAYAVKYDVSGNVLWAKSFGEAGAQVAYAVGTDGQNNVYVAGSFENQISLSSGNLKSAGAEDIFVLKLAP
jgi:hypothetical protein